MEQLPQFPEIAKNNVEQIFPGETKETRKLRKELEQEHIVFRILSSAQDSTEVIDEGRPVKIPITPPDYDTLGIFWKNEAGVWEEISRGERIDNITELVRDIHANWPRVSREGRGETEANKPEDLRSAA